MSGGPFRFLSTLLGAAAVLVAPERAISATSAAESEADSDQVGQDQGPPDAREIVVFGLRNDGSLEGILNEDELGEGEIAGYGRNTVGELLDDIGSDLNGDEPVVLVNGKPVSGIGDISTLPTEAVAKIQLLSPQFATRFGQTPDRRVINVVIKPEFKQASFSGEAGQATAGGAANSSAELGYTRIRNGNRTTWTVRGHMEQELDEDERGIDTALDAGIPYDLTGNVQAAGFGSQIDPALSALAGYPVAVAGIPAGKANPVLADFVGTANRANRSPMGSFRSLLPRVRQLSTNLALLRNLSPRSTLSLNLRADLAYGQAKLGAAGGLLRLPYTSPFTPFSQDVLLARYLGPALEQNRRAGNFSAGGTYNTTRGEWRFTLTGSYTRRTSRTTSERGADLTGLEAGLLAGSINPFATLPSDLLGAMRSDRSNSRSDAAMAQLMVSGPIFRLPAGAARVNLRLGGSLDRNHADTVLNGLARGTVFGRDEVNGLAGLDLPLLAAGKGGVGAVQLNLSAGFRHASQVGTLPSVSAGMLWRPSDQLSFNALYSVEEVPPSAQILSDAIVVTGGVRVYDFLRNETVAVDMISGGNPQLRPERRRTWRLGGDLQPFDKFNLHLVADYVRQRSRDATAALPPVSADVQAAFPDRYQRDANGLLTRVDARSVTFARDWREQLRWGLRLRHQFGKTKAASAGGLKGSASAWRIDGGLYHTWVISSTRQARAELPVIDLLNGGATGYGGGVSRHALDLELRLSGRGFGLDIDGNWRGPSQIRAGAVPTVTDLHFASLSRLDLRLWADVGTFAPDQAWAKGLRLTLNVDNVTDRRQRVRDGSGLTPLRYQPALLDPRGRTVTLALRKTF